MRSTQACFLAADRQCAAHGVAPSRLPRLVHELKTTPQDDAREADSQGLGWATASTTLLSLKFLCGGGVPSSGLRALACLFSFFLS